MERFFFSATDDADFYLPKKGAEQVEAKIIDTENPYVIPFDITLSKEEIAKILEGVKGAFMHNVVSSTSMTRQKKGPDGKVVVDVFKIACAILGKRGNKFPASCTFHLAYPKATVLLYGTGAGIITGATSIKSGQLAAALTAEMLIEESRAHKLNIPVHLGEIKVRTIQSTVMVGFYINLKLLHKLLAKSVYNTDRFPGLFYKIGEKGKRIGYLVFERGIFVIAGGNTPEMIIHAMNAMLPILAHVKTTDYTIQDRLLDQEKHAAELAQGKIDRKRSRKTFNIRMVPTKILAQKGDALINHLPNLPTKKNNANGNYVTNIIVGPCKAHRTLICRHSISVEFSLYHKAEPLGALHSKMIKSVYEHVGLPVPSHFDTPDKKKKKNKPKKRKQRDPTPTDDDDDERKTKDAEGCEGEEVSEEESERGHKKRKMRHEPSDEIIIKTEEDPINDFLI